MNWFSYPYDDTINIYDILYIMIRVMEQTAFDSQVIGQKDKSKSILDVWKQVWCFFPVSSSAILFYFLCLTIVEASWITSRHWFIKLSPTKDKSNIFAVPKLPNIPDFSLTITYNLQNWIARLEVPNQLFSQNLTLLPFSNLPPKQPW